ncbi:hypothetical protein, partial [Actinophytocola sp.]|uniref:hypothetical protein n=1 Tax=Actinophytocola sp. TaxID=1872138 RepID=UPI003D6A44FE
MPDDERLGGTHSSAGDSNGYGRRHRRAEEPSEQPRRRRRSMEDGPGGLSVADLVQRHSASRQNLTPVNPDSHSHRASQSSKPTPHRRPAEGQSGRPSGRRPGEAAGGPQWP